MSENKFIKRLKGEQTAKSVLEIKNESAKTSFANMPQGTSNAINVYSDHRGNATAVLEGTDIWKLNNSLFVVTLDALGDGRDFTSTYTVFGSSLWVNATYTFDQPKIFTGATQWVLKLCGHSLLSRLSNTIGFSLIIKFGNTTTITKSFSVSENAFEFCKEFIIDFSESEQTAVKVTNGDTMTVQLLCADVTASATIYNGMTTLVAQQRRVDGDAVASDLHTFEDLEVEIAEIREDLDELEEYVDDTFLPLAGGTMTGDISFQYNANAPVLRIIQSGQNTNHFRFINNNSASQSISMDLSQAAIHPLVTGRGHVGTSNIHFGDAYIDKIYTVAINNGYDISVPVTASADSFALESEITDINGKIPAQASSSNQLADKSFVNSSISTNTANFIGTFNSVAELEAYSGVVTNNDYAFVIGTDLAGNTTYNRYKYNANAQQWIYEYTLNNSSFTATQWATINSGGTAADVALARSAVQPSDVGNGTITITQGGETKGSFTTNQDNNTTIDIDAGGDAGRNVGDIFLTMRNDNELNGAVECDGATYNTTDFTGAQSIGALLEAGKIDYISLSAYSTAISTKGWCDKIGWDGAGNTAFRVPTLNAHIIQTNNIPVIGNGMTLGLTDGTNESGLNVSSLSGVSQVVFARYKIGQNIGTVTDNTGALANITMAGIVSDPTKSGLIADTSDTAQLRVMVQLATSASDEAVETCTGVLADVAALKYDYVVDFQAPTAENNYTWYRKYKSGWVEQGGQATTAANSGTTVNFPVEMADANYQIQITCKSSPSNYSTGVVSNTNTTTSIKISTYTEARLCCWEVKGMAAN